MLIIKKVQIELPDYIEQMMKELSDALNWKDREIIMRSIERLYKDFVDVGKDPVRIFHVYRKDGFSDFHSLAASS